MNWLALIPTAVSIVTHIFRAEDQHQDSGAGPIKKADVLAAVGDVANVTQKAFGYELSTSEIQAHLSIAIDEVVWWLNFVKAFKHA